MPFPKLFADHCACLLEVCLVKAGGPSHPKPGSSRGVLKEVKRSWENKAFYMHIRNIHLLHLLRLVGFFFLFKSSSKAFGCLLYCAGNYTREIMPALF